jgi:DNA-binding Xre family transcriptional regulator
VAIRRITRDRRLTDEEAERYQRIRAQIAGELPDIRRRARAAKPRILLKHVLKELREERQRQGLSLADVNARSGIDRGTLSKLENEEDPNVTMNTLMRYAQAVGKVILVHLEADAPV